MNTGIFKIMIILFAVLALSCGGKNHKTKDGTSEKNKQAQGTKGNAQEQQAQKKIISWMGEEAAKKVKNSAGVLARDIMQKAAKNASVKKSISNFTAALFKEKSVKKKTDTIMDKATNGFGNKLKLFGKALAAGGVSKYKKKIKLKTLKVATEVMDKHIKEKVLKDPRVADIIKKFLPVLSLQGKLAAATLQGNLSPKVAQKVFGLSLKLSVAGKSEETSQQVEKWISGCNGHVEAQLDKLFAEFADLKSVNDAVTGIIIEILGHKTTKRELAVMMVNILNDPQANKASVKVYENVAFDKSADQIKKSIKKVIELPIANDQLFAALERLAAAPGAGALMEKHLSKVSEDPKVAALMDDFFINLLVTCGDVGI